MSDSFASVPEVDLDAWLRPLEDREFSSILSVVPAGFEAYARVFRPAERGRPHATKTWRGLDQVTYQAAPKRRSRR